MHERDDLPEPLATPEQANELLAWLNSQVLLSGRQTKGFFFDEFPDSLMKHLPEPDPSANRVEYELLASRENEIRIRDLLATFNFAQVETISRELIYSTQLRYQVRIVEGQLELERHIASISHNLQKVMEMVELFDDDPDAAIEKIDEEVRREKESRLAEKELGLRTVSFQEAQDIIELCHGLTD
jgi:hypothetical protein